LSKKLKITPATIVGGVGENCKQGKAKRWSELFRAEVWGKERCGIGKLPPGKIGGPQDERVKKAVN